jgi:hypothetical protein
MGCNEALSGVYKTLFLAIDEIVRECDEPCRVVSWEARTGQGFSASTSPSPVWAVFMALGPAISRRCERKLIAPLPTKVVFYSE